ncbi:MAG: hypothetical protein H6779_03100 [Candidatus Nomurabacteria bacterium]|nr:MAG: hypothetical protein H6779_03100 [Candidatus Nomurabacteria bacterium]
MKEKPDLPIANITIPKYFFLTVLILVMLGLVVAWYLSTKPTGVADIEIVPARPTAEVNKEPESATAYAQVQSFGVMSTSDELSAIEADLESTNLDALVSELNAIEAELE